MDTASIKDYLRDYVESITEKSKGGAYVCPLCGSGTGKHRSGAFNIDPKDPTRWKCFACDKSGDIFDLIGQYENIPEYMDQITRAREFLGDTATPTRKSTSSAPRKEEKPEDHSSYYAECMKRISDPGAIEYLTRRGISQETAQRLSIGYDPNYKGGTGGHTWKALIIPTSPSSFVARNTDPGADSSNRYRKTGKAHLFNPEAIETAESPIFITEGEIDALSIIETGGQAVGIGSTSYIDMLVNYLREHKPSQPLILALDKDSKGREAEEELSNKLSQLKISFYRADIYGEHKDANEALTADRESFIQAIREAEEIEETKAQEERAEYMKNSTAYYIDNFMSEILENANTRAISTGFKSLDDSLDGGLYPGLYIIGAISSLGKTTLVLQIADQIAQQGDDVLIISLEMARAELMAKSISRLTLQDIMKRKGDTRNAKTARGILTGSRYEKYSSEELDTIENAISAYKKYSEHLFIYEGIGDIGAEQIRQLTDRHKRITGRAPVVIVDYLQILAPVDVRGTDKQNTDKNVLELKRISRDYNTPVIGISSFNRSSYKLEVDMEAFKESGAIEYGSDVLIGLQFSGAGQSNFDVKEAKQRDPREVDLVILKNRGGKIGEDISFKYYPMFNYFKDEEADTSLF